MAQCDARFSGLYCILSKKQNFSENMELSARKTEEKNKEFRQYQMLQQRFHLTFFDYKQKQNIEQSEKIIFFRFYTENLQLPKKYPD